MLANLPVQQSGFVSPVTGGPFGWFSTALPFMSQILNALCLNIFFPGILRVPIKGIVIDGELRDTIHAAAGHLSSRLADPVDDLQRDPHDPGIALQAGPECLEVDPLGDLVK